MDINSLLKNIFKPRTSKHYSFEELKQYTEEKMNSEQANQLEKDAINDPFLSDALEGFSHENALNSYKKIEDNFLSKHRLHKKAKIRWSQWLVAASFIGLMGFSIYYFNKLKPINNKEIVVQDIDIDTNNYEIVYSDIKLDKENKKDSSFDILDKEDELIQKNNDTERLLSEKPSQEVTPIFEPNPQPLTIEQNQPYNSTLNELSEKVAFEDQNRNNDFINSKNNSRVIKKEKKIYGYTYINSYKVKTYNYESIVNNKTLELDKSLSGVPANKKSKYDQHYLDSIEQNKTIYYSYEDYLSLALKDFYKKDYINAINKFEIISTQYPGDENAMFYCAMSYYQLKEYKKAIKSFDTTLLISDVFKDESKYYLAKSYLQNRELKTAKELFQEIINEQSFYQEKAKKELDNLN